MISDTYDPLHKIVTVDKTVWEIELHFYSNEKIFFKYRKYCQDVNFRQKRVIVTKKQTKSVAPRVNRGVCSSKPLWGLLTETHPPASQDRPDGYCLRQQYPHDRQIHRKYNKRYDLCDCFWR
jgi:hypothetical protein